MSKNQIIIAKEYLYLFDKTNEYSCEKFAKYIKRDVKPNTVKCYYNDIQLFFQFLKSINKTPKNLEKTDLIDYIGILIDKKLSASRIQVRYSAVLKYYEYLVDINKISKSDYSELFYKIKTPSITCNQQTIYDKEYANEIINIFKKEWDNEGNFAAFMGFVFLVIAACTGARRSEIASLRIQDIDFKNNRIFFFQTKNSEPRSAILSPEAAKIIQEYLVERENHVKINTKNLFLNRYGKESNVDAICGSIKFIAKKYNIDIEFHAFRRGFATELSQNGASIEIVGKALGHKSLDVTTRYINNNNLLDEAVLNHSLFDRKNEATPSKANTNNSNNTPNENTPNTNNNNSNNGFDIGNTFNANIQNNNNNIASMINIILVLARKSNLCEYLKVLPSVAVANLGILTTA